MSNIRNENKLCKIHGVLHTDFAQCEEPVIDADTFCKSCKRSNKVCAGSRSCELKIRLQRQRDRRELERNPRATTPPIERNEPRFVTPPEDSPTHDTSGRRLDPRNPGKLAQEHQGARAASFDERRKLNTGLHGPVNPVDGAIADLSPAERLYGEREPLVSSDFDPGFESH
jgi:hypothetical protein